MDNVINDQSLAQIVIADGRELVMFPVLSAMGWRDSGESHFHRSS
jgi:hypothetical protein